MNGGKPIVYAFDLLGLIDSRPEARQLYSSILINMKRFIYSYLFLIISFCEPKCLYAFVAFPFSAMKQRSQVIMKFFSGKFVSIRIIYLQKNQTMFILQNYSLAIFLCVVIMLCCGSKLASLAVLLQPPKLWQGQLRVRCCQSGKMGIGS